MLKVRHPDDRRDPGVLGGDADLRGRVDRHGIVLYGIQPLTVGFPPFYRLRVASCCNIR
jgi:hypothetical protein